jgi:hypothetical protein
LSSAERAEVLRVVILVAASIVSMVGLFGGVYFYRLSRRSRTWPTAPGVVTASKVAAVPRTRFTLPYQARVGYRYKVGDRYYVATGVSHDVAGFGTRSAAQRVVDRYPEGATVTVYYHPDDPTQAVLEPGGGGDAAVLMVAVVLCGVVLALAFWVS